MSRSVRAAATANELATLLGELPPDTPVVVLDEGTGRNRVGDEAAAAAAELCLLGSDGRVRALDDDLGDALLAVLLFCPPQEHP